MEQINKPDYRFRIVAIGDSSVGKSALFAKFVDDSFTSRVEPTIGIDFRTKVIDLEGAKISIQLWDTAGQERFRTITTSYYRSAHGIIFAFDLSKRITFDNIMKWYTSAVALNPKCPKILVGTKCDLVRQVRQDEIDRLCESLDITYVETSSKNNIGVDTAIMTMCSKILVLHKDDKIIDQPKVINLETEKGYFESCYC